MINVGKVSLLTYMLRAFGKFELEMILLYVDEGLSLYLQQRGEFVASNGVKITPSLGRAPTLKLGALDPSTGFPAYINGIERGLAAGNRFSMFFNSQKERAIYAMGLREACSQLSTAFLSKQSGIDYCPTLIVFHEPSENTHVPKQSPLIVPLHA